MLSRLGITLTEEEDEALKPVGGLPGEQGDEKGINKLLTANAGADPGARELAHLIGEALVTANGDREGHQFRGNQFTKGGVALSGKGQSKPLSREEQRGSIAAALKAAIDGDQKSFSLGRVPDDLAGRAKSEAGRDIEGHEIRIDSDFVRHAKGYHPNLTDEDFHRIPELMTQADRLDGSTSDRRIAAIEFHKNTQGRNHLLIGAQLNKQKQLQLVTLKKSRVL